VTELRVIDPDGAFVSEKDFKRADSRRGNFAISKRPPRHHFFLADAPGRA
jgi:hypothetical protein